MRRRAEYQREWRKRNLEKTNQYTREWRKRNPEKYRRYQLRYHREWRKRNREKKRQSSRRYYHKLRNAAIDALGRKCVKCQAEDKLQVHHIHGGGGEEFRERGGYKIYREIRDGLRDDIELLCYSCHRRLHKR